MENFLCRSKLLQAWALLYRTWPMEGLIGTQSRGHWALLYRTRPADGRPYWDTKSGVLEFVNKVINVNLGQNTSYMVP